MRMFSGVSQWRMVKELSLRVAALVLQIPECEYGIPPYNSQMAR